MFCCACAYYDEIEKKCSNINGLGSIDYPYLNPVEFCSFFEVKPNLGKKKLSELFPHGIIELCDYAPWIRCEKCDYFIADEKDDFGKCRLPHGLRKGAFRTSYCSEFEPKKGLIE